MKRLILALLLSFCLPALAEDSLYPPLSDPLDQRMQALCVMSQRDEAFEGVPYNGGMLTIRGCLPVSMANGVIASFGVTDRETAEGIVTEIAELLVFPRSRGTGRAEMKYLASVLDPQARAQQEALFPHAAQVIGGYAGKIQLMDGQIDAQRVKESLEGPQAPGMLVGRLTVHPDWSEMIRIAKMLTEMGYGDAVICLAHAGAGTESSSAPLRSGKGGHYVAMMMQADAFEKEGRMYLMDSLPRALEGETWGYTEILRRPYPFWGEYKAFGSVFDASRITPTIVRFSLSDADAWRQADVQQRSKILEPMILFGPLVVMITLK